MRRVFKQSAQLAVRTEAVGLVLQALDGIKIEAAASGYSGWSKEYMEKLLAALDTALEQTEVALLQENRPAEGYRLPAGLAERRALREQVKAGAGPIGGRRTKPSSPGRTGSPTDESRRDQSLCLQRAGGGR